MSAGRTALLAIAGLCVAAPAWSGSFVFSGNAGLPNDSITHPSTFEGTGGVLTNTVCLNTNVLPAGVSAATVEATLQKAIRTWNRQRQVTANLSLPGGNNDTADFFSIDFESTLLHEMGHCIGLAHPNLATESGLGDALRNATQARHGGDGAFDTDDGADNLLGSADDLRDDDVNRYWFHVGSNDPMAFPDTIDPGTFSLDLGDLPLGHSYAANGDRDVLAALGYANTESVMQQGQFNDETQRRITPEDQAALRIGMAGLDETQGTGDDYVLELVYGGQVSANNCHINVTFGPSFAVCAVGGAQFTAFPNHLVVTSAVIEMGQTTDWYFSQTENTSVSAGALPASPAVGGTATINVSVDRLSGVMTGTPGGSFEASAGGQACTGSLSALDADTATGSCDLSFSTAGIQSVSVVYLGDVGFDASETSFGVDVGLATPTVTIGSDNPDPSTVGQAYSVVVSVSGSSGTPTGAVTVGDGTASCIATLGGGNGSCELASSTAGSKILTASYGGNAGYTTGSDTEPHTVDKATPTVTIGSDTPDPSLVGEPYSVSFTVSGTGATPTGTVQVDDGTVDCNATLGSGAGSCMLTSTSAGAKTLTAAYAGDANYNGEDGTTAHGVDKRPSTVTITSDEPDPSALGEDFSVAVTVSGGGDTPTGSVTVGDGMVSCNITLSSGSGSCDLTPVVAGSLVLTAAYGGDTTYGTGSDTEPHTVAAAMPTVHIDSVLPALPVLGDVLTVGVSVSGAGVTPTGSVVVSLSGQQCTISLSAGSGSCGVQATATGIGTLEADYGGDANYSNATTSTPVTIGQAAATLAIDSISPNPPVQSLPYVVQVSVTGPVLTPTGTVSVGDGESSCNAVLSGGSGSCELTPGTLGPRTVTATYDGDASFLADNAQVEVTVAPLSDAIFADGFED